MSYTILWDHRLIKDKITNLFCYNTRYSKRIIIINYLDEFFQNILLDVSNVKVFCYPQPGNIDPYALEILQKKGAKIYFTNPINTNVFYVEEKGILIGSANYNFTKKIMDCQDKAKDIMVYIDEWYSIDIDNIINSLEIQRMNDKDLIKFKEQHHIFWRTYDGFDDLIKSLINTKNYIDLIEENIKSSNKINYLINIIKKLFGVSRHNKSPQVSDIKDNNNLKYGMKDAGKNQMIENGMNLYCVSRDEIIEMLSNQLLTNKLKEHKRKLH